MAFELMAVQPWPKSSSKIFSSAPKETPHPLSSHSPSPHFLNPWQPPICFLFGMNLKQTMVSERSQAQRGPILYGSIGRTIVFKTYTCIFLYVNVVKNLGNGASRAVDSISSLAGNMSIRVPKGSPSTVTLNLGFTWELSRGALESTMSG